MYYLGEVYVLYSGCHYYEFSAHFAELETFFYFHLCLSVFVYSCFVLVKNPMCAAFLNACSVDGQQVTSQRLQPVPYVYAPHQFGVIGR